MEQEDCFPYSLRAVLLAPTSIDKLLYNSNPIIQYMIHIWDTIKSNLNLKQISLLLPIDRNPTFAPSYLERAFLVWNEKGIHCDGDLYIDGVFASFMQLQRKYKLESNSFFSIFPSQRLYKETFKRLWDRNTIDTR